MTKGGRAQITIRRLHTSFRRRFCDISAVRVHLLWAMFMWPHFVAANQLRRLVEKILTRLHENFASKMCAFHSISGGAFFWTFRSVRDHGTSNLLIEHTCAGLWNRSSRWNQSTFATEWIAHRNTMAASRVQLQHESGKHSWFDITKENWFFAGKTLPEPRRNEISLNRSIENKARNAMNQRIWTTDRLDGWFYHSQLYISYVHTSSVVMYVLLHDHVRVTSSVTEINETRFLGDAVRMLLTVGLRFLSSKSVIFHRHKISKYLDLERPRVWTIRFRPTAQWQRDRAWLVERSRLNCSTRRANDRVSSCSASISSVPVAARGLAFDFDAVCANERTAVHRTQQDRVLRRPGGEEQAKRG